jgi:transposase
MLREPQPSTLEELDVAIFERLIPTDHYLRRARTALDFEAIRPVLAKHYSPDHGAPAVDPVRMLKFGFLQYHDNLSDRQVIERARTDIAYRYFLDLSLNDPLPDPSTLCYFRGRLGDGHREVFTEVVAQARKHGFVKDRLRLKDATHVIANVAMPTTLALLAQVRNKLLAAASFFDTERVQGEHARMDVIRQSTEGRSDEERLIARVTHLREILAWVEELPAPSDPDARWLTLTRTRQLTRKILADQANPKAGDRTRSASDPDSRRGKHGEYFDGYLLDMMMDADSEIITAVNVLPGNGNEAIDAIELVRQEESAHGNDIERFSIDGAGFQGPLLRELEDPQGLALDVYTPPKTESASNTFQPSDFVEDPSRSFVTCPAGERSRYRQREPQRHATTYRFPYVTCKECPLRSQCINGEPKKPFGRHVRKSDYEAEHKRARAKATTPAYEAVRREHPKVERKLSEMVRWHGGRQARYRGRAKVLSQELITAIVVNVKRMAQLLCAPELAPAVIE